MASQVDETVLNTDSVLSVEDEKKKKLLADRKQRKDMKAKRKLELIEAFHKRMEDRRATQVDANAPLLLLNFYRFVDIPDVNGAAAEWKQFAESLKLRGTILIAQEGVNVGLAGVDKAVRQFLDLFIESWKRRFSISFEEDKDGRKLPLCLTPVKTLPFNRLRVRIKSEIIKFGKVIDLGLNTKRFVSPKEFDELARQPDVVLLDTRNTYEVEVGTFKNAVTLPMESFAEMHQDEIKRELEKFKNKRLLTFCTGGVRCEKAVPFLVSEGFDAVQLDGGILAYLKHHGQSVFVSDDADKTNESKEEKQDLGEKESKQSASTSESSQSQSSESLWVGECFVFDDRHACENIEL